MFWHISCKFHLNICIFLFLTRVITLLSGRPSYARRITTRRANALRTTSRHKTTTTRKYVFVFRSARRDKCVGMIPMSRTRHNARLTRRLGAVDFYLFLRESDGGRVWLTPENSPFESTRYRCNDLAVELNAARRRNNGACCGPRTLCPSRV